MTLYFIVFSKSIVPVHFCFDAIITLGTLLLFSMSAGNSLHKITHNSKIMPGTHACHMPKI